MEENRSRFDRLLSAMAHGQKPNAGKTPATPSTSSQDGDADSCSTWRPRDSHAARRCGHGCAAHPGDIARHDRMRSYDVVIALSALK